jgi:hypothetical protein
MENTSWELLYHDTGWKRIGRDLPFREEAEESPMLEAVTGQRLVKTQQAGKYLACAVVICRVWRLAMALPSFVHKLSINPKPRLESLIQCI